MQHAFFFEAFDEEVEALRARLGSTISAGFTAATIQELDLPDPPAGLISTRTQSEIPDAWANRLDGILSRSTGYDHLAAYRARVAKPLAYGYLPLYCSRAVAEHALLLWMALLRRLPRQTAQWRSFNRDGLTGLECEGKHLLVVGVGHIGYEVVRLGRAMGMRVSGVDIDPRHPDVDYVDVDRGLAHADVAVCAMSRTGSNDGYFNYERLRAARRGLVFVNIARGEMTSAVALRRLLDEGILSGVGLDVYDDESRLAVGFRASHEARDEGTNAWLALAQCPNVILTPHNAFNTHEAVRRKAEQSIRQVETFLRTGAFHWTIPAEH